MCVNMVANPLIIDRRYTKAGKGTRLRTCSTKVSSLQLSCLGTMWKEIRRNYTGIAAEMWQSVLTMISTGR